MRREYKQLTEPARGKTGDAVKKLPRRDGTLLRQRIRGVEGAELLKGAMMTAGETFRILLLCAAILLGLTVDGSDPTQVVADDVPLARTADG